MNNKSETTPTHYSLFTSHQGYDHFNKMTAAGSASFGYDNNGNMTSKTENSQTTTYSYDYENHMTGITYPDQSTNSFGYYGTGQRAWKVDSAGTSRFVYDGDEYGAPILAEVGGGGDYIGTYTHGVNALISQRRGSTTNWYAFDDLGSTRNLTNSSQTITDAYTYKAFGEIPASSGSTTNPFRYIGALNYYKDSDSTFLMLGARYYGPQWGRFTSLDPAGDSENPYLYVGNGPTAGVDASGELKLGWCWGTGYCIRTFRIKSVWGTGSYVEFVYCWGWLSNHNGLCFNFHLAGWEKKVFCGLGALTGVASFFAALGGMLHLAILLLIDSTIRCLVCTLCETKSGAIDYHVCTRGQPIFLPPPLFFTRGPHIGCGLIKTGWF